MSKCSDLRNVVWDTVCTIGAFLLLLLAVVAIAALFGLLVVTLRLPIDIYIPHFSEKTVESLQRFNSKRILNYYHIYSNYLKNNLQFFISSTSNLVFLTFSILFAKLIHSSVLKLSFATSSVNVSCFFTQQHLFCYTRHSFNRLAALIEPYSSFNIVKYLSIF